MNMNINASVTRLLILTLPLFVYGQVSIVPSGSATVNTIYTLSCTVTSFIGTASWAKDASTLTTCTSSMCSVGSSGIYTFSSDASGIKVVMNPVSSSVDGLWKCTSSAGDFQEINVTSTSSTTTPSPTQPPTTTPTSPSPSSKTCMFIKAKSCVPTYVILAVFITLVVVFVIGCFLLWKRNQRDRHRKNSSDSGKEKIENNSDELELRKQ